MKCFIINLLLFTAISIGCSKRSSQYSMDDKKASNVNHSYGDSSSNTAFLGRIPTWNNCLYCQDKLEPALFRGALIQCLQCKSRVCLSCILRGVPLNFLLEPTNAIDTSYARDISAQGDNRLSRDLGLSGPSISATSVFRQLLRNSSPLLHDVFRVRDLTSSKEPPGSVQLSSINWIEDTILEETTALYDANKCPHCGRMGELQPIKDAIDAIKKNDYKRFKALMHANPELGLNIAKIVDKNGSTCLMLAAKKDVIFATGRGDYPNQVYNLLAFPYVFRGALDAG